MYTTFAIIIGIILDFILGDPSGWFHPIRLIGLLITGLEKIYRRIFKTTHTMEFIGGLLFSINVVMISTVVPALILYLAWIIHPIVYTLLASIMCYQIMATKCLKDETMKVYYALKSKDINQARKNVSMLVGRDTDCLTDEGITKAAVETIAENASDGCIAPLVYIMLGGPVIGFLYKSINTLDSMVGYKNDKYLYFGRTSARLDDVINYIPARFSAYTMIVAAKFLKMDAKMAYKIHKRDCKKSSSPNSAQTESVCAGALGIQLLGDAYYFGELYHKPVIGEALRKIEYEDIKRADSLLYATVILAAFILILIRIIIFKNLFII